jgi:pimeloyl-ACP methyl ester carboxylesterase
MGGMTLMALADQRPELFGSRIKAAALVSTSSGQISSRAFGLPARFDGAAAVVAPRAMNLAGERIERRALRRTASAGTARDAVTGKGARAAVAGDGARAAVARDGAGDAVMGDGARDAVTGEGARDVGARRRVVRAGWRELGPALRRPAVRQLVFGKKVDPAEVDILMADLAATPGRSLSGFFEAITHHDLGHALKVLEDLPVEIMHGTRDRLLPPRHANRMAHLLPSARLWMYPGAGHMLMQERPRDVTHRLASLARKAAL